MDTAFVIMPFGKPDIERVWEEVFEPALRACGLDPKRVDKDNEGTLLITEIGQFIQDADILIADLTYERPNCYLEVGYAMGKDKYRNLVLSCREDHRPDSPGWTPGGPKLHFDVAGYDVLFWSMANLTGARQDLEGRIRKRMQLLASMPESRSPWEADWFLKCHERTELGLHKVHRSGFVEICAVPGVRVSRTVAELNEITENSQFRHEGWTIAMNDEYHRPQPKAGGIVNEIVLPNSRAYQNWGLSENGLFYLAESFFENEKPPWAPPTPDMDLLYYDLRISRLAEALLYLGRLYRKLGVPPDAWLRIRTRHVGLNQSTFAASDARWWRRISTKGGLASEAQALSEARVQLSDIEPKLPQLLKSLTELMFMFYSFTTVSDRVYEDIARETAQGTKSN